MLSDMLQVNQNDPSMSLIHILVFTFLTEIFVMFPQEHDEPILKHLKDIQVKFSEPGEPMVSIIKLLC